MTDISLLEGLATTRAIRRYTDDRIPPEDLQKILWSATRAPSGSNRQPFRFVVLQDGPNAREAKRLIGEAAQAMWSKKVVTDQYEQGSGTDHNSPKAKMARTMQHYVDNLHCCPVIILPCLVRYRAPNSMEGGSIYPAVQNLMLAARATGYGGVITGFHHAVEKELRPLLKIPEEVFIACTVTMGKPKGRHGPVRRKPMGELVFEESWDLTPSWAVDPEGTRFTSGGPPG
ncbi:MAG: nitroreductase family protein [Proteobacteria bacterium]|nr:nitroreductase family protein [Pseudomonadota bacterium]